MVYGACTLHHGHHGHHKKSDKMKRYGPIRRETRPIGERNSANQRRAKTNEIKVLRPAPEWKRGGIRRNRTSGIE